MRHVLWPVARNDEHRVDPDVVAVTHVARREALRGNHDPAQSPLIEREGSGFVAGPRLDLDEGQRAPAPGNDVDLAAGDASAARKDAPAVEPEIPAGQRLRPAAALLGRLPVQRMISRTRA